MTTARPEQRRQTKDHQRVEKPVSLPRDTWRLFCRRLIACLVVGGAVFTAGCAEHIATVKHVSPPSPATAPADGSQLAQADQDLVQAKKIEHTEPMRALGGYLAAARIASQQWSRQPSDTNARNMYNYAVARAIDVIEIAPLDPWSHSLTVPGPDGDYVLTSIHHSGPDRNPAKYKITPADELVIGGAYLKERVTVPGVGAPVVAVGDQEKPDFRASLTSRRLYGGATGVIRFDGHHAGVEFVDPLATERVTVAGRQTTLAADYTAPVAVGLVAERPERLGLSRLLQPEKYADTARLTRLQPYDPNKIPVVFVHGLQDTPTCWVPMINALWADPEIRRRYQFWVYSYPSGYPYPYSAALFRDELDAVKRAFPDRKDIVLVGHSMGGMISRLMITDAGEKIWRDIFGKSPADTAIPADSKKLLEKAVIFNHRPEVRRVIFMSSPHRGARMASNWIGRIGAALIRTPVFFATLPVKTLQAATTHDAGAMQLNRIPNSIDTLSPNNRFVREVNDVPITPGIPYHTIFGDRGRGDTPNSSDGVVAYWSAHLKGAQSELIVPTDHGSPRNPQAIAEVKRILKLHLKS